MGQTEQDQSSTENPIDKRKELADSLRAKGFDEDAIKQFFEKIDSIVEDESLTDGDVKIEEIRAKKTALIIQTIMAFVTGENVKSIIESWGDKKKQIIEAEAQKVISIKEKDLQDIKSARRFLLLRYIQDIVLVALILGAIICLAHLEKLQEQVTGTLVGAIIGYALGRFKSPPKEN